MLPLSCAHCCWKEKGKKNKTWTSCHPLLLSSHLPNSIYSLLSSSSMSSTHLLYSFVYYPTLPSPTFLSGHSQSYPPSPHLFPLPASLSLHSSVNRFSLDLSSTKTRQCPVEYTHSRQGTTGYGSIDRRLVDPMAIHCYYSPENNWLMQTGSHGTIGWNIWFTCMDTHACIHKHPNKVASGH